MELPQLLLSSVILISLCEEAYNHFLELQGKLQTMPQTDEKDNSAIFGVQENMNQAKHIKC